MGYYVLNLSPYCSCISKGTGLTAAVKYTGGRRTSLWAAEADMAIQC